MADQAKGKGIAPKRASNPADPGQSSRPPLPIRTLLEDKEDGKDYSEFIEVLKQQINFYKQVIASQSSNIKTLLLSLNTLKASIEDSVSAIKNISSTLASLTNSSNAATTGKTSYSPRFDPFSGTMDLDSPPRPPRKESHLGPAVNSATCNSDPPIDIGSKEGFKDTITSSIVKQSKKEDVYNEFHALTFSTYKKGLSAFNTEFNGYLAKLTIAKIDIDPSLILNQNLATEAYRAAHIANSSNSTPNSNSNPSKKGKNKKKGKKKASYNIKGQNYSSKSAEQASFILGSFNLAIEEEEESDSSSNSSFSSDSNTQLAQLLALKGYKKRKDFKAKGLKTSSNEAKYKDNKPRRRPKDPALYNSWLYNTGSTDHVSNSKERFTTFTPNTGQLRPINTGNGLISLAGIGSITLEVLSRKAPPTYTKLVLDNVLYLPNIDINIISRVRHYDSGGCLIKETLYGDNRRCIAVLDFKKSGFFLNVKGSSKPILHANFAFPLGPSSYTTKNIELQRNKRTREPKPLTSTGDLPYVLRELVIEGNKVVEKAISSPTLKEPNIGQQDYYNLLNLDKLWHVKLGHIGLRLLKKTSSITKGLPNFDKIKEANFHCSSYDREGDTVKIRPRPYNRNPIVLLLVNRKSRYRWVFNLPNKSGPIVANAIKGFLRGLRNGFGRYPTKFHFDRGTEITDLLTTWLAKRGIKFSTSAPYIHKQNGLVERSVRVILDLLSQPTDNTALEGELVDLDLDLEGAVSLDPSNLHTEKPISIEIGPSKLEPYESSSDKPIFISKPIEVIAPNQPITNEPLDNSNLISEGDKMQLDYYKLLAKTSSYILSFVYKARKRVIFKDSTPTTYKQVLKLPRDERNDCLFIGPDIGYITDLKKRLNKVYAIEDLGPAAYFLGMQIIRDSVGTKAQVTFGIG
ncbi:hypothetical protein P8C59_000224 [Phyllachora maydis]|uniref:Integrase catalytic domain-containing protein n=1 Tax=Phyllachora maydis TaxID=1825666 RepID=A0AAD9HWX5_9PEZI|nr:hypothetical protein P8C59_000224 [Phyllachora maydis]